MNPLAEFPYESQSPTSLLLRHHIQAPPERWTRSRWLAAIVESSDDAILGKALDGIITSWNAGATRIFGYEAEEAIGKHISFLSWPGEEGQIDSFLETLRRGERVDHFEVARKHKSGKKIFVSLSLSPVLDSNGKIIGISKIARDITDHKAAAASALDLIAEGRLRELIESAPDAILQADSSGAIVIANRRAAEMFGYTIEELLALGVDALVPDANRHAHAAHRNAFVEAGKSRPLDSGLDLGARRKDGTRFPVDINLSPVHTKDGINVTAIIRDLTERRLSEQRERALQESYMAELEMRHKEAESAALLKSEFMSSVSHELRTPLHTIIGFSELLAEDSSGPLNEKQQKFLHHIRTDSEHLLGMINDVLDLSRIEAGRLTLHTELMSLQAAVKEAVSALRPFADSRSVSLREGGHLDLTICADPVRLRQILYNLLSNGAKFTGAGGEVSVDACVKDKLVEITVSDTGIGIAPEDCTHIFEKFYQVRIVRPECAKEQASASPSAGNLWRCRVEPSGWKASCTRAASCTSPCRTARC